MGGWVGVTHTLTIHPNTRRRKKMLHIFLARLLIRALNCLKKNFYRHINVYNPVKIQTLSDLYIVKKGSCLNSVSKNISFTIALFYANTQAGLKIRVHYWELVYFILQCRGLDTAWVNLTFRLRRKSKRDLLTLGHGWYKNKIKINSMPDSQLYKYGTAARPKEEHVFIILSLLLIMCR